MARPGLLLYFDILPALDKLPHEAVGELLLKALHYARDGVEPVFDDASLGFAWAFLKPVIDRDGAAYDEKRQRGDWLTYCRQCKRDGVDALDFETWRERTDNGALRHVDVALPTTAQNQPSTPPAPTQEHIQPIDGSAAVPPAPARDPDGIICISDEDFEKLQTELGKPELDRVMGYLGSYCASTGRRYASWTATIRRASKEGWGKPNTGKGVLKALSPGVDLQPDAKRIQQHNDWIDGFLRSQGEQRRGGST